MKAEVRWLPKSAVLAIQAELLSRFGGAAGLRDENLFESPLARPQQLLAYGDPDIYALAAAYVYGLARNHPFVDGNKRIAFMSAYTFLGLNGFRLRAPETEVVVKTVSLAAGECSEAEYAEWLRASCEPKV